PDGKAPPFLRPPREPGLRAGRAGREAGAFLPWSGAWPANRPAGAGREPCPPGPAARRGRPRPPGYPDRPGKSAFRGRDLRPEAPATAIPGIRSLARTRKPKRI